MIMFKSIYISIIFISFIIAIKSQDINYNGPNSQNSTLWEILAPWKTLTMIAFWTIIITVCVLYVICKYCCNGNVPRILRRGKYSNYNFVSVYSETEAEFNGQFTTDNDDEISDMPFDEISIIK